MLRQKGLRFIPPGQREAVVRWCGWAGAVQATTGPAVLVHGDFHGDFHDADQAWNGAELLAVVDVASVAVAGAEYDLRALPGPVMGWDPAGNCSPPS